MPKKYVVRLVDAERTMLEVLIKTKRVAFQKVLRARVLLKADVDGPSWTDQEIAIALDCRRKTVENIRERFVTEGLDVTLNDWQFKIDDARVKLKSIYPKIEV
jgi:hypothetical protein